MENHDKITETKKEIPTEYTGTLRPVIRLIETVEEVTLLFGNRINSLFNIFEVRWIEGDDVSKVVWTEKIRVPEGQAFVPTITGYGTYTRKGGFYVDEDGKRHFVIDAPVGMFGSNPGQVGMSKG